MTGIRVGLSLIAALALTGCAATTGQPGTGLAQASAQGETVARSAARIEADRQAIRAMAGEYAVTFAFTETVPVAADYQLAEDTTTPAREVVYVIADEPDFISLQHLLLVGDRADPMIIKHWRQDWAYEPARLMAYRGFETWDMVDLDPSHVEGAWSQTVYQVDDSPRYAGVGQWMHGPGASTWTPDVSWRPLPRRDGTTRNDYDAIAAVNRHSVFEWGWTHEQDNSKLVLRDGEERELVREHGVNTYRQTTLEGSGNARRYWDATADYWALIRDAWETVMAGASFTAEDDVDGTLLFGPVLNEGQAVFMGGKSNEDAFDAAAQVIEAQTTSDGETPNLR